MKFRVYREVDEDLECNNWINIDKLDLKNLDFRHLVVSADAIASSAKFNLFINCLKVLVQQYNNQNETELEIPDEYKKYFNKDSDTLSERS